MIYVKSRKTMLSNLNFLDFAIQFVVFIFNFHFLFLKLLGRVRMSNHQTFFATEQKFKIQKSKFVNSIEQNFCLIFEWKSTLYRATFWFVNQAGQTPSPILSFALTNYIIVFILTFFFQF